MVRCCWLHTGGDKRRKRVICQKWLTSTYKQIAEQEYEVHVHTDSCALASPKTENWLPNNVPNPAQIPPLLSQDPWKVHSNSPYTVHLVRLLAELSQKVTC